MDLIFKNFNHAEQILELIKKELDSRAVFSVLDGKKTQFKISTARTVSIPELRGILKGYTKENITIGETTIDRKQIAQIKTIYNWE